MTLRDLWLRIRALAAPRTVDRELDEELTFRLEMEYPKTDRVGADPGGRPRSGPRAFRSRFRCRRVPRRPGHHIHRQCLQDLRYAIRTSLRTPAVTITIVATIALGLGLSTAVFTIFNALVFRPDAIRDPDSLYSLRGRRAGSRATASLSESTAHSDARMRHSLT